MTASKTRNAAQDDVDEMFGAPAPGTAPDDFADVDDLLNEGEEDDPEGWVPAEKGEDPIVLTVTIRTRGGHK